MVMPHYTYLVLKMPMEQGVLSLCANLDVAYNCEKESFTLAEATDISIRMQDCIVTSQVIPPEDLEIPTLEAARGSTKSREFKEVVLVPTTSPRLLGSRPTSILNRKTCLSASYRSMSMCSHGNLRTCPVFQGS